MRGPSDDMAMRYALVNQLAFSNASKSSAIDDCVVVRMEILVAIGLLDTLVLCSREV